MKTTTLDRAIEFRHHLAQFGCVASYVEMLNTASTHYQELGFETAQDAMLAARGAHSKIEYARMCKMLGEV